LPRRRRLAAYLPNVSVIDTFFAKSAGFRKLLLPAVRHSSSY
jgi:hypothetical protein